MDAARTKTDDRVEHLVSESLMDLHLDDGLVGRIMAGLPPYREMLPSLHPVLRLGFGLTAAVFAVAAWVVNLPAAYGATQAVAQFALGVITLGAVLGATAVAVALVRESEVSVRDALKTLGSALANNAFVATVISLVIMGATWLLLGTFPRSFMAEGLEAARSSIALIVVVLFVAAGLQAWLQLRERDWKSATRLIEAAGLAVSAIICTANYLLFIA